MPEDKIDKHFIQAADLILQSLPVLKSSIQKSAQLILKTFASGGKILVCGNGGSAAEAQHFTAELTGRYLKNRPGLPAIALTTDTSALTAIGNDMGYDNIFSRQVQALASPNDLLFCITTSGASPNIIKAAKYARSHKVKTIGLSGNDGGKLKDHCDLNIIVPFLSVPYVQEVHLVIIHAICDLVEYHTGSPLKV